MILIRESKRDELILPYLQALEAKGIQKSFREFKSEMLEKLANQAGIHNLSKSSNYYLAGAVRYYFEGQLTTDGKASYANQGDVKAADNWNVSVCQQLNAVVEILRNAYIDTIGQTFEQPEDFGTLPINKLLRKYGKKIQDELNKESDSEEKDTLDRGNRVGNGYTFDILPNYESATKYERWTSPGAWCITYGQNHYDGYIRRLNIHYVIFLKDGYQNVERKVGPEYTREKPHDEYGNSMIALLQSNTSWKPVYITSRWNHGYNETSGTEADYAYNLEEFCKITGVSVDDLKRIYEIWRKDYANADSKFHVDKKEMLSAMRKLKYAQMMINGGDSVENALSSVGVTIPSVLISGSKENLAKSTFCGQISENGTPFSFIVDKKKIVFETFFPMYYAYQTGHEMYRAEPGTALYDAVIIQPTDGVYMIYNTRFHELVNIGGKTKFKRIPEKGIPKGCPFMEVNLGKKDIALLSTNTLRPLKLPNGEFWFNAIVYADETRWENRAKIYSHFIPQRSTVLKIVYDESSMETYYYNIVTNKFFDFKEITDGWDLDARFSLNGYFAASEDPKHWYYYSDTPRKLFNYKGERTFLYGYGIIVGQNDGANFIKIEIRDDLLTKGSVYYDTKHKKFVAIGNTLITSSDLDYRYTGYNSKFCLFKTNSYEKSYVYDRESGLFLKNPCGYPSKMLFSYPYITTLDEMRGHYRRIGEFPEIFPDKTYPDDTQVIQFKKNKLDVWDISEKQHISYSQASNYVDVHGKSVMPVDKLELWPNNTTVNNESLPTNNAENTLGGKNFKLEYLDAAIGNYKPNYMQLTENEIIEMINEAVKIISEGRIC